MEFGLACIEDLEEIKDMFRRIVRRTHEEGNPVWSDFYPVEFLHEDVENGRMYVLRDNGRIISAFALCPSLWGKTRIEWAEPDAPALHLERLGTHPDYWHRGIAKIMMKHAEVKASELGAKWLRLFVVESNKPALSLYRKCSYTQIGDVHDIYIDENCTLHSLVMEKRL